MFNLDKNNYLIEIIHKVILFFLKINWRFIFNSSNVGKSLMQQSISFIVAHI